MVGLSMLTKVGVLMDYVNWTITQVTCRTTPMV